MHLVNGVIILHGTPPELWISVFITCSLWRWGSSVNVSMTCGRCSPRTLHKHIQNTLPSLSNVFMLCCSSSQVCRGWEFPPAEGFALEMKKTGNSFVMFILVSSTEVKRSKHRRAHMCTEYNIKNFSRFKLWKSQNIPKLCFGWEHYTFRFRPCLEHDAILISAVILNLKGSKV